MPVRYSTRHLALLFLLSAQTFALNVLWHNGVYALGIVCFGPGFWGGGDEAVFFILALFFVPTGFAVGAVGRAWQWAVVEPIDGMSTRGIHLPNTWPYFIPFSNYRWLWKFSRGIEVITDRRIRAAGVFAAVFFLGIIGFVIVRTIVQRRSNWVAV